MNKRYQLWHYNSGPMGDVDKDMHEADNVTEALALATDLRRGCFDLFKLFDTQGDPTENLWPVRLARKVAEAVGDTSILEDCVALAEIGREMERERAAGREYARKLDEWWDGIAARKRLRDPATNPATRVLLEQVSEANIRSWLSVRTTGNLD